MRKLILIFFIVTIHTSVLLSQHTSVKIDVESVLLTDLLKQLKKEYNFHFSYSESQLSAYVISITKSFEDKSEAVHYIFKDLPFVVLQEDEVFIIVPQKEKLSKSKSKNISVSGYIVESGTLETLPFSHVIVNGHASVSNELGYFSCECNGDSSAHIQISHLGYFIYDTLLTSSVKSNFELIPSNYDIPEIIVKNNEIERATQVGTYPGKIKLNHAIAGYLPGQGDNTVFNFLKLMPGILAAGEQSSEPIIWGSYEGQTQIVFDEFLLFGLKNYNDNISVVNPLVVKDIEVYKSGYDARYSNRVGGIINITGKNGNRLKPSLCLNINPTTLNGLAEIPVKRNSSVILAYRQTYYNLYNGNQFNIYEPFSEHSDRFNRNQDNSADLNIYPDSYVFRDWNFKYSLRATSDDVFSVSLYNGGDRFKLNADTEIEFRRERRDPVGDGNTININLNSVEKHKQYGGSVYYAKNWNEKTTSKLVFALSGYKKTVNDEFDSNDENFLAQVNSSSLKNNASELVIKQENQLKLSNKYQLDVGLGFYADKAKYLNSYNLNDSIKIDTIQDFSNNRAFIYLNNNYRLNNKWLLKPGMHINVMLNHFLVQAEPRLSVLYEVNNNLKASLAWGMYHQYLFLQETVDREENYNYLWVTNNQNIKPISAVHYVAGINYFKNNFTVNIESYYKNMDNLPRLTYAEYGEVAEPYASYSINKGKAKAYGVDFLVKKDWNNKTLWASYTLSKTLESFSNNANESAEYVLAPHDQRHEFKAAGVMNYRRWYYSMNYIYGSGIEMLKDIYPDENLAYNRLDAAITYKFRKRHYKAELGLSVLNVMNTENLKYKNIKKFELNSTTDKLIVNTNALPFTPTLFLKLQF